MTVVATVLGSVVRRLATGWARRAAGLVVVVLAVQQGMLVADEVDLASAVSLGGGAPSHVCCHGKK